LEALIWIIGFIGYMAYRAYRAYTLVQRKQAASKERQAEIEVANRRRRGEVIYEDMEPKQELPWDFDPDIIFKEREVRTSQFEMKQVPPEEENAFQKKLKTIGDEKRDRSKREVGNVVNEREAVSTGFSIQLDSRSLVTAVIMSEVLQPPRAKRPIRL